MSGEKFAFPASFAQARLWFLERLEPGSARYNLGWALSLRGHLDLAALRRALAALEARHEALRTTFADGEEGPLQIVAAPAPAQTPLLPILDLSGVPEAEARRRADTELRRPLDLERGPLARFTLLRLAPEEHVLVLAIHHIVSDAWSLELLLRELAALYGAFAEDRPADLPELPVQYADFAVWQRDQLSGEVLAGRLAWWRERLAGSPAALDLPTDRPRPPIQTSRGRNYPWSLPLERTAALREVGRGAGGSTLFMTLLAGFSALLGRITGQDDIPLGSAVAGRDQVELEEVVGLFANTLVLRCDLAGDPAFRELLARMRETTLAAAAHGDLPFEKLVEELRPERDLSRTPLFQVVFDLHPAAAVEDLELPGLAAAMLPLESRTAKFDLTLSLAESPRGVAGLMQYNADLFEAATVARLMAQYETLLAGAAADPAQRLSTLPLLRPEERHQLLVEWRGGGGHWPAGSTLPERLAAAAAREPERPAVTCEGETLTYRELHDRAGRLARRLRALGAGPGVPVGIALERSLDLVAAVLGVLASGSSYLPLDPSYPDERLAYMLEDSGAPLVVTCEGLLDRLPEPRPAVVLVEEEGASLPSLESFGSFSPASAAYVIYTSGSTGRPKGVVVTHANVLRLFDCTAEGFGFGPDDVWTLFHSYAFDFSVWEIFGALLYGGRLVVVPHAVSRSPEAFHDLLRRERVTVLNQTPSAFAELSRANAEQGGTALPDLRWVLFGGEALNLQSLRRWFADHGDRRPRLVNLFGITETTVHVTWRPLSAADLEGPAGSVVGGPIPDLEMLLLDRTLEPVPIGVPGEIFVGGPGLARGYLGRPETTAERFVPHAWPAADGLGARLYRSGDLARRLPSGDVEYLGRIDRQVKVRGFRIELGEIEAALARHPGVGHGAVLLDGQGDDRRLVAYVVPGEARARPLLEMLRLEKEGLPEGGSLAELPNGMTVAGSSRSEAEFLYKEIFAEESYLRHGITLPPGAVVFDVGANIGMFSLFAAARSAGATVYAFEPIPAVFALLSANARLYGLDAKLFDCGLAARQGSAEFVWYPHLSVLSGRFADSGAEEETVRAYLRNLGEETDGLDAASLDALLAERLEGRTVTCRLTALSDVIREHGVERIDLLKIDVEKSELDVLAGIAEEDWPKIRQVVVEVHDLDGRLRRVEADLAARGFRVIAEQDRELGGTALYNLYAVREASVDRTDRSDPTDRSDLPAAWTWSGPERWIEDLRAHLRKALPEHLVPTAFVPLAELPRTANGKLDRAALPAPSEVRRVRPRVVPQSEMERAVAAIWCEVLGLAEVGVDESFFDLGGHSLLLARVHSRLGALLGADRQPSMVDLFRFPTVAALAAHLAGTASAPPAVVPIPTGSPANGNAIAVVGMSGRFPGAASVDELWDNLAAGIESISFFPEVERRPGYVAARGLLEDADLFDAPFFGLTPREAELLDPQQRLLLEQVWTALEDAGYPPESCPQRTGVFAGVSRNTYLRRIEARPELLAAVGEFPATMANHNDFLATRVSYKLDLKGPAVNVQSACSTSLLAVHLACRGLLQGDCDLALAGGVSVKFPQLAGYLYQEGGIVSPDGHCRPFDAAAAGTVSGEGVAVVVLKRLADALADGDRVRAVIRGTAVNNDGAGKVGYTAPGVEGQAAVIAAAQVEAGVTPETITYVEAHGTGTPLGDPIEVAALAQAFGDTKRGGSCALGSVKGNLGHLDAAAGATGLIKTVLALEHRQIPPSLGFERPNPEIDFAATPFYVNARLAEWRSDNGPRRAGVSAFGVGGTNVHAVLEEAPETDPSGPSRPWQLLVLSARSAEALDAAAARLRKHLEECPDLDGPALADAAWTLRTGRRTFAHRRAVVCRDRTEALAALGSGQSVSGVAAGARPVAFLFPGQGAQRPGATAELYAAEPGYRERIDRCAELLGLDLREVLFTASESLDRTEITQPALFAVEWSLAGLWSDWGVIPEALLGHSLGEYVAACLAGVFTLEDALALVAERGRLMQLLPAGAMLAVPLAEADLAPYLKAEGGVVLAAVNAPERSVLSGPVPAIERLERELAAQGVTGRRLRTSHAFHSAMADAVLEPFARRVGEVALAAPKIPFLSNVTGTWIRAEEATDPAYWAAHLRRTVRFAAGLDALLADPSRLLLEVGPGGTLGSLARRRRASAFSPLAAEDGAEQAGMLAALGGLWCAGARVDWRGFQGNERRRRVPLPTYPFERRRYWVEDPVVETREIEEREMSRPTPVPLPEKDSERRQRLLAAVAEIFAGLLGGRAADIAASATFLDLGADSLALIQASRAVEERLGARVPFRRLLEDLSTPAALAGHLDAVLPPDPEPVPVAAPVAVPAPAPAGSALEDITREHLRVMSRLLDLMGGQERTATTTTTTMTATAPTPSLPSLKSLQSLPPEPPAAAPAVYIPYQPVKTAAVEGLGDAARRHVEDLIARYNARTPGSKRLADADRPFLADNRAVSGFRGLWKEMVYPIVSRTSAGSRFRDVDGNEYVDMNMGFGVHFFGHSPDFLTDALREQLAAGMELGPRAELAGEVARGVCELTGMERAAFCATGTEAVMTALRVARTATRRSKVALFAGSYHGAFDGTLAKAGRDGSALPMAPGVLPGMVGDLLVFDYGAPESLERIAACAGELAAVLVEPVQSRRPDIQPADFLRELRRITRDAGVPLVFDEIVTGFRVHPAGAGGLFGVRPDLATYGKVLGGGLPIGVVAGRASLLDALDGGAWRFGDGSVPEAELTFFACTFAQHPLSLAAARAVLARLRSEGPALQERLNARAARLAERLDAEFRAAGVPLSMARCGSILRVLSPRGVSHSELLYFHLVEKGIYAGHGRPMFVSTAHTDEDLDRLVDAVRRSVRELAAAGLLSGGEAPAVVSAPAPAAPRSLPLTEAQEQLWVLSHADAEAAVAYNQSLTLRLSGPLDVAALEAAFQDVVDRHEALRITFSPAGDRQLVHPTLPLAVPVTDTAAWRAEERPAHAARWADAAVREPFDLVAGPLLRAHLLRQAAEDHLLVVTVHHIVSDGWSLGIVLRDLAAFYGARLAGRRAQLPPPAAFSSYVEWQRALESGPEGQAAESWWLAEYAAPPAPLSLPADRSRTGAAPTFVTSWERLEIDAATWGAARAAGARCGGTALTTLLASWQVILHRLSGAADFAVGVPSAGQLALGEPDLVGFCVELLPLRLRLDPEAGFAACLAATGRQLRDAQEHRAFPFGALLKSLRLPRVPGRVPLVQTTFNLDREGRFELPGLGVELLANPSGASDFDLDLNLIEHRGGGLSAHCDFRAELFEPATVRRWLGSLRTLLAGIASGTDRPVAELPLLDATERAQVLAGWGSTAADRPRGVGLHHLIEASARRNPGALAVVQGEERMTYGELDRRAGVLARRLRDLGVGPEVPVGVLLERSPLAAVAFLGVLKAGGAYVPLDPAHPQERRAWTLADARAPWVLTTSALAGLLADAPSTPLLLDREDLVGAEAAAVEPLLDEASLAYILYTSGSTGRPKGALVSQGSLVNHAVAIGRRFGLGPADRMLQFASLAFDVAAEEMFPTWVAGGTVVLRTDEALSSIPAFVEQVARERVTVVNLPCSYWHAWVDEIVRTGSAGVLPPPGLRMVVIGDEPASPERAAAWLERVGERVRLLNAYGLTEVTITATAGAVSAATLASGVPTLPVGRPLDNTRAVVLDGRGEPVPPGVTGELYLTGEGVARGYLGNPATTAVRFVPDPFATAPGGRLLRTGDLGRWRLSGGSAVLEIVGRADRQVKVRGHRIELEEVEGVLASHPGLQSAVAMVREDASGDRRLVAYVVPWQDLAREDRARGLDLWPTVGEYGLYDELMYHSMTSDEPRNRAYREAVARVVPGKVVVDVGTGRDVLWARFAVSAGAQRVYAIELLKESYREGLALLERLGLTDRIHLIRGDVSDPSLVLPELADVCISELIGNLGSSEGTTILLNAARRLVKPDGRFVPYRCVTRIAGVELPAELLRRPALSDVPRDYARRVFEKVGRAFDIRLCTRGVGPDRLLSTAADFEDLLLNAPMDEEETREVVLEVERAGRLDGFLLWIRLETAPGLLIDSLEGDYHWLPVYFPAFSPGVEVAPGDRLEVACSRFLYSDPLMPDYRVRGRLRRRDGREVAFDHESACLGETLGGNPFHRAALAGFAADGEAGTSPAALRSFLAARLPEFMVPSAFVTLERLPLLSNGKVDRRSLPETEAQTAADREPPATPTEREVAAAWREVLGCEPGAVDDFFLLGGHSLKAVQVLSRLRAAFGVDLGLREFFAAPTVRGLAGQVEEKLLADAEAAELEGLLDRMEMEPGRV